MEPAAPQTFRGVTPDQYARLAEKAKAAGIDMVGNGGTASWYGVDVAWMYVPEAEELTIRCLKTPFFMRPEVIDAKIRDLVRQSLP